MPDIRDMTSAGLKHNLRAPNDGPGLSMWGVTHWFSADCKLMRLLLFA